LNSQEIKDEILLRINPQTYSMSSNDLTDIMNMFNIEQNDVIVLYNQVVNEQREELKDTTKDVVDYFRSKGYNYPSFEQFKREFDRYDVQPYIDDKILRDMHKNETEDPNQLSMFEIREIIREEFSTIKEFDDDFERAAARIKKNWGGETAPEEEFSAEEFFGDAGDAAQADIEAEYGEDEFAPYGTMEDPRGLKDLNEEGEEEIGKQGMFMPQDSQGNRIKLKTLVKKADGSEKSGRVVRLGDDGKGGLIVVVDWQWPVDMKYISPDEMGEMDEYPENLIVQNPKQMNEELNEEINEEVVAEETVNEEICDTDASEGDAEETIEEMRGLGSGVNNSGDRNVKMRDDHAHAPLTNLSESLNKKINTLFEGSVKRRELIEFINEEAKKIAKDII